MLVRYVAGKVAQALFVLWAAFTVTFFIVYLLPGDSVTLLYQGTTSDTTALGPDEIAAIRATYGLDQPIIVQYASFLLRAVTFDLGTSLSRKRPVVELIQENVGPTVTLALFSLLLALVIGTAIAVLAQYARFSWLRGLFTRLPWVTAALPTFWVGLILIQVFSFALGWFPSGGSKGFSSIVLPAIVMAIPGSAMLAQVLGRGLADARQEPYVATAVAKGIPAPRVFSRHVLKNAILPTVTIVGLLVAGTVTGAVISETVFSRQGIGRLTQQAVSAQDIPLVQGIVLVSATAFVVVNLVVDVIYPLLDPRIVLRSV